MMLIVMHPSSFVVWTNYWVTLELYQWGHLGPKRAADRSTVLPTCESSKHFEVERLTSTYVR